MYVHLAFGKHTSLSLVLFRTRQGPRKIIFLLVHVVDSHRLRLILILSFTIFFFFFFFRFGSTCFRVLGLRKTSYRLLPRFVNVLYISSVPSPRFRVTISDNAAGIATNFSPSSLKLHLFLSLSLSFHLCFSSIAKIFFIPFFPQ